MDSSYSIPRNKVFANSPPENHRPLTAMDGASDSEDNWEAGANADDVLIEIEFDPGQLEALERSLGQGAKHSDNSGASDRNPLTLQDTVDDDSDANSMRAAPQAVAHAAAAPPAAVAPPPVPPAAAAPAAGNACGDLATLPYHLINRATVAMPGVRKPIAIGLTLGSGFGALAGLIGGAVHAKTHGASIAAALGISAAGAIAGTALGGAIDLLGRRQNWWG
jgi:hypothetical protein